MLHNSQRNVPVVRYSNLDKPEWAFRAGDFSVLQIRIPGFQIIQNNTTLNIFFSINIFHIYMTKILAWPLAIAAVIVSKKSA